jgi:hypothetical protein
VPKPETAASFNLIVCAWPKRRQSALLEKAKNLGSAQPNKIRFQAAVPSPAHRLSYSATLPPWLSETSIVSADAGPDNKKNKATIRRTI